MNIWLDISLHLLKNIHYLIREDRNESDESEWFHETILDIDAELNDIERNFVGEMSGHFYFLAGEKEDLWLKCSDEEFKVFEKEMSDWIRKSNDDMTLEECTRALYVLNVNFGMSRSWVADVIALFVKKAGFPEIALLFENYSNELSRETRKEIAESFNKPKSVSSITKYQFILDEFLLHDNKGDK